MCKSNGRKLFLGDTGLAQRGINHRDDMLLVRTRTHLACYERALSAANIPFDAGSRGGLLAALEVRDIVALFEFFVTPVDDLKLAHALRSPVFACSDEDLLRLAARTEACWWQRLQDFARRSECRVDSELVASLPLAAAQADALAASAGTSEDQTDLPSSPAMVTDDNGIAYAVSRNEDGIELESDNATLYLGVSCDASSPQYGKATWQWQTGSLTVDFGNRRIVFETPEPKFANAACLG